MFPLIFQLSSCCAPRRIRCPSQPLAVRQQRLASICGELGEPFPLHFEAAFAIILFIS